MDSFLGRGYMPDMSTNSITELPFMKMHGLGNDFVVVDARANPVEITPAMARGIAHRQFGVGFDQLAVIEQNKDTVVETLASMSREKETIKKTVPIQKPSNHHRKLLNSTALHLKRKGNY